MLHKPISKMWLLYVCLLTLFAGCSKCNKVIEPKEQIQIPKLPPATQTGEGTFGCLVNGQVWLPIEPEESSFFNPSNPSIGYDATFRGGSFGVQASSNPRTVMAETIGFSGSYIGAVGEYNLTNSNIVLYYTSASSNNEDSFMSGNADTKADGKVIITKLDKMNKIVSGTFSFTMEKPAIGKKVVVTDGRFDLKYL